MLTSELSTRLPWPENFPDVIVHTGVKARDAHPGYDAAKSGDPEAALALVEDLMNPECVIRISVLIADQPTFLLPVIADETSGFNAIPDAMAQRLRRQIGSRGVVNCIVQTNKVGHTRAPSFQRLVTPAAFDGTVEACANYLLVGDHVGLGGTLANLRGHVEANGGKVIGITTLTESRDACHISLRPEMLAMLWGKHGDELEQLWQNHFGHGIDCLTQVEAGILCRQLSVDTISDFLAQASIEARGRGLETALGVMRAK